MKIAVDAMGSDRYPAPDVEGALRGAREYGVALLLVGKPDLIETELTRHDTSGLAIEIVPASQAIEMTEAPANAVRSKPDSSMVVGMKLLKEGRADAFVSMGNTGGMLAAGILHLGRIKGIKRPALSTVFPVITGHTFILDIGANADVKPDYLAQFALMGALYAERVLGVPNPRVGLVSNGEEEVKGSEVVQAAHQLIKAMPAINFIGNVEGRDIPLGTADVVVTDGFTGNVIIKLAEGLGKMMKAMIREELKADPLSMLGGLMARRAFDRISERTNYARYGGAPLLGVDGVVIVGHGSSTAFAVKHAVRVARTAAEQRIVAAIRAGLEAAVPEAASGT
ncbi:MAG: phosphate acyltransferase PlsX [Ardenticatenaceae bacterium]|nr:phosphate acyltransferase PlsX [Ardenticatenaceae bacterium]HBY98058.1 phosphate acyltransferase PlsX [Chloroflexota bacterium]